MGPTGALPYVAAPPAAAPRRVLWSRTAHAAFQPPPATTHGSLPPHGTCASASTAIGPSPQPQRPAHTCTLRVRVACNAPGGHRGAARHDDMGRRSRHRAPPPRAATTTAATGQTARVRVDDATWSDFRQA